MKTENTMEMRIIGRVKEEGGGFWLEIDKEYRRGLLGLEEFSHIILIWGFDKAPWDGKTFVIPHCYKKRSQDLGVLATRGPFRPSPIALSVCRILSLDMGEGRIELDWLDAENKSPVLDIKPYHPSSDAVEEIVMPSWCAHWPKNREASGSFDWNAEFTY